MKTILNLTILVLLATSLCMAQKISENLQPQGESEVRKLTRLWDEAMVKGDVKFLDSILSDDYIISGRTKRQYLELITSSQVKYTAFDREIVSLRVYGDTALVFGQANINGQAFSNDWFSSTFSFMDVWVKQQERWRCVATKAEELIKTYQKQKIVKFGPEVQASLVVVFKSNITDGQIESFRHDVLQVTTSNEGGRRYLLGIREYLRVPQIQNHDAVALTFHDDITKGQREEIIKRIKSSPIVYKVFEDIAPAEVKLYKEK